MSDRIPVERWERAIVSDVKSDVAREIEGWLYTCNETLANLVIDQTEQAVWATFHPHMLDEQLPKVRLELLPVDVNHETRPVGRFLALNCSDDGGRVILEIEDTPAGDEALAAADDGRCGGLSPAVDILRSIDRGTRDGLRRVTITKGLLRGASLCPEQGDSRAIIEFCMGETPLWRRREEALARHEFMRNLRPVPARTGARLAY